MTGIITRSHRVNHATWKHVPKERSCCNVVRHLNSATNLHKQSAKSCTGGVYNEKETKSSGSKKKGFRQELDKKTVSKAKHVQTSVSLENEDSRERPAVSVYSRITRAKSKFILGTEMASNDSGGDFACRDAENAIEQEKSKMGSKGHKIRTQENIPRTDAEFVEQTQYRMIEGRMTRSKNNTLRQIQADKVEGAGYPNDHTNEESCIGKPGKNPILTYDHTLQRKRKRMSAVMYGEELDYSYGFTGNNLASEPLTKKDLPVGVTTRSAIHKQNASTTVNNQIINRQSNGEPQDECKKADVTEQEQLEFADHLESQEKSKSCKWKDIKRNVSSSEALIKPYESSEQKDGTLLCTKHSQLSRNLRNTRSTVGRGIVDPVQISEPSPQKNPGEKVLVHGIKGSRKDKVIAMASIPKRMTRSMQKDSSSLISHKRKRSEGGQSLVARKHLRIKKQPSSFTLACTEETESGDEQCVKNDNKVKMKSEEPDFNSCGKLDDKDQCKSGSNYGSGFLLLS